MTKLLSQAINLQNTLGLDESHLATIQEAMRSYAADTLNVAVPLIERRDKPDVVRKFIEPHGITFDGKKKIFK